jgi:hypothetical protein
VSLCVSDRNPKHLFFYITIVEESEFPKSSLIEMKTSQLRNGDLSEKGTPKKCLSEPFRIEKLSLGLNDQTLVGNGDSSRVDAVDARTPPISVQIPPNIAL